MRRETMYQCMKKSLAKASRDDDVEEAVKVSKSFYSTTDCKKAIMVQFEFELVEHVQIHLLVKNN